MSDLNDIEAAVNDEASFINFLNALAADWEEDQRKESLRPSSPYDAGANGWENVSAGDFLEAASAWARSTGGRAENDADKNPWRRAAEILHAGKFYE
ncbi:DUF7660 family protein [Denitrobaculum tricleocarpae]|uniref:DUF7660 domain-containing protein n=1 Tax=Denitrobaculum tricleocarpae TaxID=2591009 RepID=A0A545TYG3_9PROT|nr:hypothetical protein [Denitrobaculum tricleocarpae]TQV82234.1 hypothetical protein FKG95_08430 [Denitrobaculum tricleocarpae]